MVIGISVIKTGIAVFNYLNRHRRSAERIIRKTNTEVVDVIRQYDNNLLPEIDDVTAVVRPTTIDTLDHIQPIRRRVRIKAPFRAYLVRCGKAKFGQIRISEANRLVVRAYLYNICVSHGVLARHIADNLDFATRMVFVKLKSDLVEMAVNKTKTVKDCASVAAYLGGNLGNN